MPAVKKLRHVLEDTLSLLADLEQDYRNVLVQFTCYRNNRLLYQSSPMKRGQLSAKLPDACRQNRATEVAILITGTNQELQKLELHKARFMLAAKRAEPVPYHRQQGLGGYEQGDVEPESWGSGLGTLQQQAAMCNKILAEERFMDKHEKLQEEAAALRTKVSELEKALKEQEAEIAARDLFKERIEQFTPFLPFVTQLFGSGTTVGNAISGLAGITGNLPAASNSVPADDAHTTAVLGLVRRFMSSLHPSHKSDLLWVMQRVQKDPGLINRIAQSIKQSQAGQAKPNAQKQKQNQEVAQQDNSQNQQ